MSSTETENPSDCLVLKIEEYDVDNLQFLDNSLFVFYDKKQHHYVVRGQRNPIKRVNTCTYSFVCNDIYSLYDFITFVNCKKNLWTYILYNYDNFPADSNDIDFQFLKNYESQDYELTGYNKLKFKRRELFKVLGMLRSVYNEY